MISIIVVTYNSERVLGDCLRSLESSGAEVIVVDNASADASVDVARRHGASVIANPTNRGFAAACNQGAAAALGDGVLMLNPDTQLDAGLAYLESCLESDSVVGAAAGLLVDSGTGLPQRGFTVRRLPTFAALAFEALGINRLWPGNPVNRRYRCLDLDPTQPQDVEQPAGACLLVRRRVWAQLGGLDEGFYPVWFEDVDFCLRLARAGHRIRLEPRCRFFHDGGHSIESIAFIERQLYWYGNLFYYVRKNIGSAAAQWIRVFVGAGAGARIMAALLCGRFGQLRAYQAVIALAFNGKRNHV